MKIVLFSRVPRWYSFKNERLAARLTAGGREIVGVVVEKTNAVKSIRGWLWKLGLKVFVKKALQKLFDKKAQSQATKDKADELQNTKVSPRVFFVKSHNSPEGLEILKNLQPEIIALRGCDILCFSHDWTGDPLSKTHLMRVLSRDNRILWVNAIANRMPTASSKDISRIFKKLKSFTEPVREVEKNIFVLNPLAIPAYGNEAVRKFNQKFLLSQVKKAMRKLKFQNPINIIFNPAAGLLAGKLGESALVYYCVDEYTAFTGASKGLKAIEDDLFRKADLVIVSAEKLFESKKQFNRNTFIIRHGVDFSHFRKALDDETKIPEEIANLPKPIIGFHGLLADWIDFKLIKKIAEHFSNASIVLIGKIAVDAEKKIKILENVPNIHFLGRKPYAELPAYCKGFDVALNPFAINELTLAANPLKVREYLAAGLETVSTDIPEARILEHCRIGKTHEDFIFQIEEALKNPKPRQVISDSIKNESWEAKVDELRRILSETHISN